MEQYQHSPQELRAIADLVDAMNAFDKALEVFSVSVEVGPEIWWCDRLMGHITRTDENENEGDWTYRPARGEDVCVDAE